MYLRPTRSLMQRSISTECEIRRIIVITLVWPLLEASTLPRSILSFCNLICEVPRETIIYSEPREEHKLFRYGKVNLEIVWSLPARNYGLEPIRDPDELPW
jgi:hypothetical protein